VAFFITRFEQGTLIINGKAGIGLNGIPGETAGGQPGHRHRVGAGCGAPGGIPGMMGLPFGAGDPRCLLILTRLEYTKKYSGRIFSQAGGICC